jgi:hypothetical protein
LKYKIGDIFQNSDKSFFIIYEIEKPWGGLSGGYRVKHISQLDIAENSKFFREIQWENRIVNLQLKYVRNIFE